MAVKKKLSEVILRVCVYVMEKCWYIDFLNGGTSTMAKME